MNSVLKKILPLFCVVFTCASSRAVIAVTGLTEKTTYVGSVDFTIPTEIGFEITAFLNEEALSLDTSITENRPGYHELFLTKIPSAGGETEELMIPFVVRDPARPTSDRGISTWTPRPVVAAPDAVLDATSVTFVAPSTVTAGMPFPLVVRLENTSGEIARVNAFSLVSDDSGKSTLVTVRRGAGAGSWVAPATGPFTLTLRIGTRTFTREISLVDSVAETLSGDLSASQTFPANSVIDITADTMLPADMALRFEEGCLVRIAAGATITMQGSFEVAGTLANPVVFLPSDPAAPWGGFFLRGGSASADIDGAFFTGGGAQAGWTSANGFSAHRKEQPILTFDAGTAGGTCIANMTDVWIVDNPSGQAAHGRNAAVTFERCVVQRTQSLGQFNGGAVQLFESHALEFPVDSTTFSDADNDGIYLRTGDHHIRGSVIGWAKDDAIDCGSSTLGTLLVEDSWIDSCFHEGFALSGDKIVTIDNTVTINNGQGLELGYSGSLARPAATATNMLIVGNAYGARYGDNYNTRYNGTLDLSSSLILQNRQDVFGVEFRSWTYREDKMTIENNVLTSENSRHPVNVVLDPATHAPQIDDYLESGARGFTVIERSLQNLRSEYGGNVSLHLDRPAASPLSIPWEVLAEGTVIASGSLEFPPGEVYASLELPALEGANVSAKWIAVCFDSTPAAIATGSASCHFINLPETENVPEFFLVGNSSNGRYLFWTSESAVAQSSINLDSWLDRPDLQSPLEFSNLVKMGLRGFVRLKDRE